MSRHLLLSALSITLSAAAPIPLTAPIRVVRVHPDEAWVTRMGSLKMETTGGHRFAIHDLPPGLRAEDIKVSAKGPSGTRLGEVSLKSDPMLLKETPEWKQFKTEQDPTQARRSRFDARKEAHKAAEKFLNSLVSAHGEELSRRLGSNLPPAQSLSDLAKVQEIRGAELKQEELELQVEEQELTEAEDRLSKIETQLQNQKRQGPTTTLVELNTTKVGTVVVSLAYRTLTCLWTPAYEARLSPDKKRLELVLMASVKQSTGEDWKGVRLEIATQPGETRLEAPEITAPIFLNLHEGTRHGGSSGVAQAQGRALPSAVFALDGTQDLPSGTEAQRFKVSSTDLPTTLRYLALPRESAEVFQLAEVRPGLEFPLYPQAPIQLLVGSQRLGSQSLDAPPAGEAMLLSFGPAPGLSARLRMVERKKDLVGTFTKERQWSFKERLEVGNGTDAAVEIDVQDRAIRSSTETVKVTLGEGTTQGWKEPKPGLRSWSLTVPPRDFHAVELSTLVRAPLEGHLTNLGDLHLEGN